MTTVGAAKNADVTAREAEVLALSVATEAAAAYRDGVWFVDLVQVADSAMVIASVAQAVGVPEQSTGSTDLALVAALAGREALLVLDNCEHVLDGVRDCVERILAGCPDVRVLATSRTRLMVPYEWVYAVPGLSAGDAVALFSARVAASTGGPTALGSGRVAALCAALDGIALATELAAARYATLGLDGLEAGLDERLRFLTGGAVDRLGADIDDPLVWRHWGSGPWRPWYAAVWSEAAVLAGHPDAADRIVRSRHAARDNPIAVAVVERAAAIAARDHDRLVRFAITFAQLGCRYRQARSGRLAAALR